MPVLKSSLDVAGPGFARNRAAMQALLDELAEKTAKAALGGPEASRLPYRAGQAVAARACRAPGGSGQRLPRDWRAGREWHV